ncbi:superoxide dismutase [Klebsiella michiganensis]|nr:superoxide dismutase [Klebsiella michiganensis]
MYSPPYLPWPRAQARRRPVKASISILSPARASVQAIGSVKISETAKGLEFTPDLKALPPGEHGFHIHANGSCQPAIKEGKAVAAGAAGGHYDPQKPVSMKVPTALVTSAICRSLWSITMVKQPSRWSRRA